MSYGKITDKELTLEASLVWQDDGSLINWSQKLGGGNVPSIHEVDVASLVDWLDKTPAKEQTVFELVNRLDHNACNWVMVQQVRGSALPEKDYTRFLWGVTPKQLVDFIREGIKRNEDKRKNS